MEKNTSSSKGFTLVELLLTMAIISILAGSILVSLSSQRRKAHEAKVLAEFSGTIQPMLMCRTDGGTINIPSGGTGGGNICAATANLNAATAAQYGTWPSTTGTGFGNYVSADLDFDDGGWHFYADDGTGRVCCNSGSSRCHGLVTAGACTNTSP